MTKPPRSPEPPLTAHPAYSPREVAFVRQWLAEGWREVVYLPIPAPLYAIDAPDPDVTTVPEPRLRTLCRYKAAAPAPYVGRPFAYRWYVAVDELGRQITGPAEIVYLMSEAEWDYRDIGVQ